MIKHGMHDFKDGRGKVLAFREDKGGWYAATSAVFLSKIEKKAAVTGEAYVVCSYLTEHGRISGAARVEHTFVGHHGKIRDRARVRHSRVYGDAVVGGDATLVDCVLRGNAIIGGDVKLESLYLSGPAVITEQRHVVHGVLRARTGNYPLAIYRTEAGTPLCDWGCRIGIDLERHFERNKDYAQCGLDVKPLQMLEQWRDQNA